MNVNKVIEKVEKIKKEQAEQYEKKIKQIVMSNPSYYYSKKYAKYFLNKK